jgi:hypothetical protein
MVALLLNLHINTFKKVKGASMAKWLRLLTSNHLPLSTVGSNPDRDFGFFHVRKLST